MQVLMARTIKLIIVNVVIFVALLIAVNWACSLYLRKTAKKDRAALPNYAGDREHAKAVFADYNRLQHTYEPFTGWKTLPYSGETTTITKDGLRTHYEKDVPPKRGKVVHFFGGSTTWGEGSDDQHTIPALFNQINPDAVVYNHGQLAYNSRQELDALISLYSKDRAADLVIFYDGVNDAAFLCPKVITQLPAHRLVPMYRDKLYQGNMALVKQLAWKAFAEDIAAVVRQATFRPGAGDSPYDCLSNPGKAEEIADMMMKNWELAHEIVTRRNGKFIAVLQPAAFIGHPRTDHLELDEDLGQNFRAVYRRIRQKIAEKKHPWIVDLTHAFDGREYIYIDFCHVSPNGNAIVAREISKVVNSMEE